MLGVGRGCINTGLLLDIRVGDPITGCIGKSDVSEQFASHMEL